MKRRPFAAVAAAILALAAVPSPARPHRHAAQDRSHRTRTGVTSFYGRREAGKKTASGAPLRPDRMTAASPTLPLGTRAKVTNPDTGKSAIVTVNDRGPNTKGRLLDVTPKVAERIGITPDQGVAPVKVTPVSVPPAPQP